MLISDYYDTFMNIIASSGIIRAVSALIYQLITLKITSILWYIKYKNNNYRDD